MTATDAGLQENLIAGLHPVHQLSRFAHDARDVVAEYVRQRNLYAGQPRARPNVEVIQSTRANLYQNFVCARARLGALFKTEDFRPPVFVEDYGFHNF